MSTYVIIPAAGQGRRMGGSVAKQYLELLGIPILIWTVRAFHSHPNVEGVVLAVPPNDVEQVQLLLNRYQVSERVQVEAGGDDRQATVALALQQLPTQCDIVLVHDAVRPLVTKEVIDRVIAAAAQGAVTAALPATETVKVVHNNLVVETLDRSVLWSIQTPQGFPKALLERAHHQAPATRATDDCALVEALGERVSVVQGAPENIKITTPADLPVAELRLGTNTTNHAFPGVGLGYDVHRLVEGRTLVLGGVCIPYERGLLGHSDADVLLHAVMDAILGAAGLGDIGHHFPDTDPTYKGISSMKLLQHVASTLAEKGLRVEGVDVMLIAEKPKIARYVPEMKINIAATLGLPEGAVNVKATTNEHMGFVGREEGMAAQAVARVKRTAVLE